MIPLLLDMGLPRRAATDLRAIGWDVVHVGERDLGRAADSFLVTLAKNEGRTVITLDADFSAIVALSGDTAPSIVHVRLPRVTREKFAALLQDVVSRIIDDLRAGCLAVVTEQGIRVRALPLAKA